MAGGHDDHRRERDGNASLDAAHLLFRSGDDGRLEGALPRPLLAPTLVLLSTILALFNALKSAIGATRPGCSDPKNPCGDSDPYETMSSHSFAGFSAFGQGTAIFLVDTMKYSDGRISGGSLAIGNVDPCRSSSQGVTAAGRGRGESAGRGKRRPLERRGARPRRDYRARLCDDGAAGVRVFGRSDLLVNELCPSGMNAGGPAQSTSIARDALSCVSKRTGAERGESVRVARISKRMMSSNDLLGTWIDAHVAEARLVRLDGVQESVSDLSDRFRKRMNELADVGEAVVGARPHRAAARDAHVAEVLENACSKRGFGPLPGGRRIGSAEPRQERRHQEPGVL